MDAEARWVGDTASELAVPESPRYEKSGQGRSLNIIGDRPLYPYAMLPWRRSIAYTFEPWSETKASLSCTG
jgi:hypothetical protein